MRARWTLLGGLSISAASALAGTFLGAPQHATSPPISGLATDADSRAQRTTPIVRVARKVGPTVVNLYSELQVSRRSYFGTQYGRTGSLGAGVLVHPSGLVVTNAHVITANLPSIQRAEITASFRPKWDGSGPAKAEQFKAELLGFNPENDLALLRIRADRDFPAATLGTSSDLMIGETVVAVGNPYGREGSVTHGIISAVNRDLEVRGGGEFQDLIQTDAPLNAGNSGGPLFNILGELIGINQAIGADQRLGRADGQGLAIPVDRVRHLIEEQFTPFELGYGDLGFEVEEIAEGVRVRSLRPRGPAVAAGLRVGDRIRALGEFAISTKTDFNLSVLSQPQGAALDLRLDHDGVSRTVRLTPISIADTIRRRLGAEFDILSELRRPIVEGILQNSPAEELALRENDVLLSLAGQPVHTMQDVFRAIAMVDPNATVEVKIRRYRIHPRLGWSNPVEYQGAVILRD